jgi:hypothetical protein
MARLAAILRALWRAFQRGEKSFASLAGNNFFLVAVLFLGKAGTFLFLIMGLVILFPLSTDPLRKIPPSRLALWPLEKREMWLLRWPPDCSPRALRSRNCLCLRGPRCGGGFRTSRARSINLFARTCAKCSRL